MTIEMFTDGLAEPRNPGIGTYAYGIYRNGELLAQDSGFVGESVSNNEAEYEALLWDQTPCSRCSGCRKTTVQRKRYF
jgi:ribonuclease HI